MFSHSSRRAHKQSKLTFTYVDFSESEALKRRWIGMPALDGLFCAATFRLVVDGLGFVTIQPKFQPAREVRSCHLVVHSKVHPLLSSDVCETGNPSGEHLSAIEGGRRDSVCEYSQTVRVCVLRSSSISTCSPYSAS